MWARKPSTGSSTISRATILLALPYSGTFSAVVKPLPSAAGASRRKNLSIRYDELGRQLELQQQQAVEPRSQTEPNILRARNTAVRPSVGLTTSIGNINKELCYK